MSGTSGTRPEAGRLFGRRNLLLMAAGICTIVAGYAILASGAASLAALLLVLGYVVILPMALLA